MADARSHLAVLASSAVLTGNAAPTAAAADWRACDPFEVGVAVQQLTRTTRNVEVPFVDLLFSG